MKYTNFINKIKKILLLILALLFSVTSVMAGGEAWNKIKRGWSIMPIKVYLDNTDPYTNIIKSGFLAWEKVTDEEIRFKFVTKPHAGYANITVRIVPNFTDNKIGLTKAQMGVNKIYKSNVDIGLKASNGIKFTSKELELITIHEIGHSLGLPHSPNPKSIMYPYAMPGQRILDEDIEKLLNLY